MNKRISFGYQESDKLKGFVSFIDKEYPFFYDHGILDVYPADRKFMVRLQAKLLSDIGGASTKGRFLYDFFLDGITASQQDLRFLKTIQILNGYISFGVRVFITTMTNIRSCARR